eukprot:TRINITY_DN59688_c0_g1_i1.p1 TRINITY_DN59688_c0_g1~~TRINITY_DN59688_c0_g1_i1.p1  ORF type:complete len:304 (+),score=11.17 TRINITY_DN59688_c0_g1_i1:3-914(+)
MEQRSLRRLNLNFVLLSAFGSGPFSTAGFPGFRSLSAAMFIVFAALSCICNLLTFWTSGLTNQSSRFAHLHLFFFACACFSIHLAPYFTYNFLLAHASFVIAYTWLYHSVTLHGRSPVPHMCCLALCLSCAGALKLFCQCQADTSDSMDVLSVTMIYVVGGASTIHGAGSLDQVRNNSMVLSATGSLRSICASIWRMLRSCTDCSRYSARDTLVEVYELNGSGKREDTAVMRFVRDIFSAMAPRVCSSQRAPKEDACDACRKRVTSMIQSALHTAVRFQADTLGSANVTDPLSYNAVTLQSRR